MEYFNLCPPRFKYLLRKIPPLEDELYELFLKKTELSIVWDQYLDTLGGLVVRVKIRYIDLLRSRGMITYRPGYYTGRDQT